MVETVLLLALKRFWSVLGLLWAYLLVFAGFAYFIHWNNGSIVLGVCNGHFVFPYCLHLVYAGDRSNHQASVHVMQLCYFVAFATAFLLPIGRPLTILQSAGRAFKRYA